MAMKTRIADKRRWAAIVAVVLVGRGKVEIFVRLHTTTGRSNYRVTHLVANLGWVD